MRICLIGPPIIPGYGELARAKEVRSTLEQPPLGVLSLAAVLEQQGTTPRVVALDHTYQEYLHRPHATDDLDFCSFAVRQLASIPADVFGFSTVCSSYPLTVRMARKLRQLLPKAIVIFGGPQASVVDRETLEAFPAVDLVVRGEGEETLPRLIQALSGAESLERVPGIAFRAQGKIVRNADAPILQDLDSLPLPAYHHYLDASGCQDAHLELGRGCPFSCSFCSTNDFFRRRFRLKSPRRMIEQMETLRAAYGVRRFVLVHDMFTVDRKRVVEFCKALLDHGRKFNWTCSARTDCIDAGLLELMARAGCGDIFFGIESGSSRMQRMIEKNLDLDEAARAIELAGRNRIGVTVSLIAGFPEETEEDLRMSADFLMNAARQETVTPQLHVLIPLAKTPIQTQYRDKLILNDIFSDVTRVGWEQAQEEIELIRSYPEIFPNFYSFPTLVEHSCLEEFRAFLQGGITQFRWLMLALAAGDGGILTVFNSWRDWRAKPKKARASSSTVEYYFGENFVQDFFDFLQARILTGDNKCTAARTMLEYEIGWREAVRKLALDSQDCPADGEPGGRITLQSIPKLAWGIGLLPVDVEASRVILQLKTKRKAEPPGREFLCVRVAPGERIQIEKLSPLAAQLLTLCDGQSDLEEICRRFTANGAQTKDFGTLNSQQVCIAGIIQLAERGLLKFSAEKDCTRREKQFAVSHPC